MRNEAGNLPLPGVITTNSSANSFKVLSVLRNGGLAGFFSSAEETADSSNRQRQRTAIGRVLTSRPRRSARGLACHNDRGKLRDASCSLPLSWWQARPL